MKDVLFTEQEALRNITKIAHHKTGNGSMFLLCYNMQIKLL